MSLALTNRKAALLAPWNRNPLWSAAGAVPSLDLRFAESKSLTDEASGQSLVTFTRASSGTYVGSDGVLQTATTNEPRFDHNPTTGESLGLLVEEQRTNLLVQSNGFDTTWTNTNSTETSASGIAPDGTNTAWQLRDTVDASAVVHSLNQTITFTAATAYTFSVWGKAGTLDRMALILPAALFTNATARSCSIAFSTGAVSTGGSPTSASAVQFPNGWWRVSITVTVDNGVSAAVSVRTAVSGASTYQGDGNGTILIWGAQLESGSFPTSYIPTTTTTATRSADVASITGANFSSWYRQDEGTVFAQAVTASEVGASRFPRLWAISDGTTNNAINGQRYGSGTFRPSIITGGVNQAVFDLSPAVSAGSAGKFVYTFRKDDIAGATNGGAVVTDASAALPTVDQMRIGDIPIPATTTNNNGAIARITYWPQRLSNPTLQAITQ